MTYTCAGPLNLDHQHRIPRCCSPQTMWSTIRNVAGSSVAHRSLHRESGRESGSSPLTLPYPLGFSANFIPKILGDRSIFHGFTGWIYGFDMFFHVFWGTKHQLAGKRRDPQINSDLGRRWGFASWAIWSWTFGTAEARCQHVMFLKVPMASMAFFWLGFFWKFHEFPPFFWRPRSVHGELFRISAWEHLPALRGRVGWCGWSHQIRHGFPGVSFFWLKPLPRVVCLFLVDVKNHMGDPN